MCASMPANANWMRGDCNSASRAEQCRQQAGHDWLMARARLSVLRHTAGRRKLFSLLSPTVSESNLSKGDALRAE